MKPLNIISFKNWWILEFLVFSNYNNIFFFNVCGKWGDNNNKTRNDLIKETKQNKKMVAILTIAMG